MRGMRKVKPKTKAKAGTTRLGARRLKVGVVFGGRSVEHDVSLVSARAIMDALDRRRYDVIPIPVSREGRWPARIVERLLGRKAGLDVVIPMIHGTDGEDGPTDAAGAWADADTLPRAAALGLDPAAYLERHDAYAFFAAVGGLLKIGLTQTNVMDVRVILVGP